MKKIFFPLIVLITVAMAGCDKNFQAINTNPNNPEVVSPNLLMVNIIRGTINDLVNDGFSSGNVLMQYMTQLRDPGIDRYSLGSTSTWDNGYADLRNVQVLYNIADQSKLDNYKAIAKIMRVVAFLPYDRLLRRPSLQRGFAG